MLTADHVLYYTALGILQKESIVVRLNYSHQACAACPILPCATVAQKAASTDLQHSEMHRLLSVGAQFRSLATSQVLEMAHFGTLAGRHKYDGLLDCVIW